MDTVDVVGAMNKALELKDSALPHTPVPVNIEGVQRWFNPRTGAEVSRKPELVPTQFPRALRMSTLSSLVTYLAANRDGLAIEELILNVVVEDRGGPDSVVAQYVELLGPPEGETLARPAYAVAQHDEPLSFDSDEWHKPAELIIDLQTMFVDNDGRKQLLSLLSRVSSDSSVQASDDGIVQSIIVRQSASLNAPEGQALPNPVVLRLYRTFREIAQPEALFTLRSNNPQPGHLPMFRLIPIADGGWLSDVRDAIEMRLGELIGDVNEARTEAPPVYGAKPALLEIPIIV